MKARLVIACALIAVGLPIAGAEEVAEPMRDEDVVVLFVQGTSTAEIIKQIKSREVDFDLAPDMVSELQAAGVPAEIIAAMRERQAEVDAAKAPPEPEPDPEAAAEAPAPAPVGPTLRVKLLPRKPDADPPVVDPLVYPTVLVDAKTAEAHGLGNDPARWTVTDLAVFLGCTTSDHVPDQWRSKTPLGRDFVLMPRHRLLAIVSDSVRIEGKDRLEKLRKLLAIDFEKVHTEFRELTLPDELTAEVEPGVAHDLVFGIAAKIGERYLVVTMEELRDVVPDESGVTLEASAWCKPKRGGADLGVRIGAGVEEPQVEPLNRP
jgi:hypothetical protein